MRKFFIYTSASFTLLIAIGLLSTYLLRDKIINRFIEKANEQLATPVTIEKIEVSLFSHFPLITMDFKNVYIEDSHKDLFPLFTAKHLALSFNLWDAWDGKYIIQALTVVDSETNIRINKKGTGNFQIAKDTLRKGAAISFDLKNIRLTRQRATYIDEFSDQSHELSSSFLAARVELKENIYSILAEGDIITNQIGIGKYVFLKDKLFNIDLSLIYDHSKKEVVFNPSKILEVNGDFELSGNYQFEGQQNIDLTVEGKNTNIQTILSLFPEAWSSKVSQYRSEGDLYFALAIKGGVKRPSVALNFGCRNATIFHPETSFKVSNANLSGSLSLNGFSNYSSASLTLKNVQGKLNGKNFIGNFNLKNFNQPKVDFQFKGALDAGSVQSIMNVDMLTKASGLLMADVSMVGELNKLRSRKTAQQVKIAGSIQMKDVSFSTRIKGVAFENVNGNFQFTHNDLAMSNVSGKLGQSDFSLNGFFRNIVSYLLFDDQPIGIETDLQANLIDLDELLILGFGESGSDQYKFQISKQLYLNFDCRLNKLRYKKFTAEGIDGNVLVKNQSLYSKNLKLNTMGGNLSLQGSINAISNEPIELNTTAKLSKIYIDSLFYVFGNFRQTFIQDKNLKGQATANVTLSTKFTPELNIIPESLISNIDIQIKNGELNSFDPLQGLDKYLDDEGLKNLRFADLKNEIHIENQTILIPMMEVRSNVTTIQISGRHTFDQHIDYRIVAPLRNKKKINIEEAGDAYENGLAGRAKVYFKIIGTTDDYKVSYDTDAVKKKIASDLKKEFAELKDAFKDKEKNKKRELEIETEDYFDWDN